MSNKLEDSLIIITAMVASQVLHETLDDLSNTPYYKHQLKQTTKKFQEILKINCDFTLKKLYETDDQTMAQLHESILIISRILVETHPAKMAEVIDILEETIKKK